MSGDWQAVAAGMLDVANKLEEYSKLYDAMVPDMCPWTASRLRHEAEVISKAESL